MQMRYANKQLWRVEWISRSGVQAPTQYVEVDPNIRDKHNVNISRKVAVLKAKLQSRLGDFPEKWSCKVTNISDPRV